MIISAGFRSAEINKSESEINLKNLVEDKIVDFKRQAEENLHAQSLLLWIIHP